jgi:hypothetical protein
MRAQNMFIFLLPSVWQDWKVFDRMRRMKTAFLGQGVWRLGTAIVCAAMFGLSSAWGFDVTAGEVLRYKVFWGPLNVGTAELSYVPQGEPFNQPGGYVLQARVKSETMLMDMDDLWRSVGRHGTHPFTPQRYEVVQRENDYTANKTMAFSGKKVSYTNHKDPKDTEKPITWNGKDRDPLSTVYAWRFAGQSALESSVSTSVIGLKRPFTLNKQAARKTTLTLRGKTLPVWQVDMVSTSRRAGKEPSQTRWTIWLQDDADLTPLQIVGQTKFGTFRAQLENTKR